MNLPIIIIAAMTKKNHVIGKDGWLPWNIPEELKKFRYHTKNNTIIMGRKTFESIGRVLPKRNNIIVTRNKEYKVEGADVCNSIDSAIKKAKEYEKPIFIIGGAQIYKSSFEYANQMYLSFIKKEYEGDTTFPEWDSDQWVFGTSEDYEEFEFVIYHRVTKGCPE